MKWSREHDHLKRTPCRESAIASCPLPLQPLRTFRHPCRPVLTKSSHRAWQKIRTREWCRATCLRKCSIPWQGTRRLCPPSPRRQYPPRCAIALRGCFARHKPSIESHVVFSQKQFPLATSPVHTFSERKPKRLTRQNFHGTSVLRLFGTSEPFRRVIYFVKFTPTWMNCPKPQHDTEPL